MPVTTDIAASYRRPGAVVKHLLSRGPDEPRALAYLMAGCVLMFVANLPAQARKAHLEEGDLNMAMGGALLAIVFILPLVLYVLAWLTQAVARMLGRPVSGHGARLALFWALLAASPLILLNGLVAGLIGPGPALTLVGAIWFGVFLWFWLSGLRAAAAIGGEA
ncbi:YIP1 family protein [Thetidibacter halocola]|uniref:YIP1 family protein n=1 Tax=Thetidibacter halocola TaxID=2827239 RepID=A0A8J7WF07_9RHOB|nr:YIP1 family protein [Thetidibacter halocola]MBS0123969.1 YIP1 family protein [Thetidibacter halocola]